MCMEEGESAMLTDMKEVILRSPIICSSQNEDVGFERPKDSRIVRAQNLEGARNTQADQAQSAACRPSYCPLGQFGSTVVLVGSI